MAERRRRRQATPARPAAAELPGIDTDAFAQLYRQSLVAHPSIEAELAYFKRIFDEAPAPYVVTTPDLIISDANQAAQRMLGRTLAMLREKPLSIIVAPSERLVFREIALDLMSAGKLTRPLCIKPAGREEFDVVFNSVVIRNRKGDPDSVYWLFSERGSGNEDLL